MRLASVVALLVLSGASVGAQPISLSLSGSVAPFYEKVGSTDEWRPFVMYGVGTGVNIRPSSPLELRVEVDYSGQRYMSGEFPGFGVQGSRVGLETTVHLWKLNGTVLYLIPIAPKVTLGAGVKVSSLWFSLKDDVRKLDANPEATVSGGGETEENKAIVAPQVELGFGMSDKLMCQVTAAYWSYTIAVDMQKQLVYQSRTFGFGLVPRHEYDFSGVMFGVRFAYEL
jgi:hypothetical protein